jgi:hypothetical protein
MAENETTSRGSFAATLAVFAPAAGAYGALVSALLVARVSVVNVLAALARRIPMPPMRMDIIAWRTEPLTQSRTFVIVLAFSLTALVAHALVAGMLRRLPMALLVFEGALVLAGCILAFRAPPFLRSVVLGGWIPMAVLFAPFAATAPDAREEPVTQQVLLVATAMQAVALSWGAWIVTFSRPIGIIVGAQIVAAAFSLWRGTKRERSEIEVVAGLPFTFLPLVGLWREPGMKWAVAAVVAYGAILEGMHLAPRLAAATRRWRTIVGDVAVATSFLGTLAVVTLPYRLRDIPRLNNNSHETGAYASVNSILHGRLMMADSGLIYGPLRAYALTLYTLIAGVTAEQVRIGQVLINHAVLALLLFVGWRFVDRKLSAMLAFVVILLVGSLLTVWLNYTGTSMNAFGWADLGRIVFPFVPVVGGTTAAVRALRAEAVDRSTMKHLGAWGACTGLATLWAQEFGVCTLFALAVAPAADLILARQFSTKRVRVAALSIATLLAGCIAVLGAYVGIYALFGRAGLFLRTVVAQSSAFASGSYGAFPFPATEASFDTWANLNAGAPHLGRSFEYVAPVGVYLVAFAALSARAIGSKWRERDTVTLAVTLFGVAAFRFALGRSDVLHLWTITLPAVALAPRLLVEACSTSLGAHASVRIAVTAAAFGLALASLGLTGVDVALAPRLRQAMAGEERPSSGPPYAYPFPRAGDVKIQPEYVALVQAIREKTAPGDKIFQHIGYMDGGEVYFLADRSNPTRYDLLAEFLTTDRQVIAFEEMKADPPKLVAGSDWGMTGDAVNAFLRERYHLVGKFGDLELVERNP